MNLATHAIDRAINLLETDQEKFDFLQNIGHHINRRMEILQAKNNTPFAEVIVDEQETIEEIVNEQETN